MIAPIRKINERINVEKHDSDTSYFYMLLWAGEQLLKLVTCALVTSIDDKKADVKSNQYYLNYCLVSKDSLGYWVSVLENILGGSSHRFVKKEFEPLLDELLIINSNQTWQYNAIKLLDDCLNEIKPNRETLPQKLALRKWFSLMNELRNEALSHGRASADAKSRICKRLDESLKLISENLTLFKVPWFYVKQNVAGTYRLTPLNDSFNKSEIQNKLSAASYKDGVYLMVGEPLRIELLDSTVEALDFHLPNGNFKSKTYETLSYITGSKNQKKTTDYLTTPWLTEELVSKENQNLSREDQFIASENIVEKHDDWLVGALNFDEDLHFSSFYLDQSWQNKLPKELKQFGYECMIACYQNFEEIYYIPEGECKRVANNLIQKIKEDPNWFIGILESIVNLSNELVKVFPFNPDSMPFNNMQDAEILDYYIKHNTAHSKLYVYSRLPEVLDRGKNYFTDTLRNYLRKLHTDLSDDKKLNEIFEIFTFPEDVSISGREFVEFMQILEKIKNDENLKELFSGSGSSTRKILLGTKPELLKEIENHRQKWMYWNYHGYGNRVLRDISYFLEKFKSSVNDSSFEEKAVKYHKVFDEAERKKKEYFKKYNVDELHQKLFRLYSRIGSVKLYRRYIQLQNFYFLDQLISKISQTLNIEEATIRNLFPSEIENLLRGNFSISEEVYDRVKHAAVIYHNDTKQVVSGEFAKSIARKLKELSKEATLKNDVLIGEPCVIQEQMIKGQCKVVLRKEDMDGLIFNYGDILVCEAADPDLYDLMKIASAVLTEQGGVTSHSSTYCRENNIKSITGIKGLLENIFNNDLVEVDTSLGRVYKISSSSKELIVTHESENINKDFIGSKAFNLFELQKSGFNVPNFFCIPLESLRKVLQKGTQDSVGSVSQALWDEVNKSLSLLDGELFAIRSSFNNEDGDNFSGAGANRSELHLTKEDIIKTVISLASEVIFAPNIKVSGSLIIQQMILGDISGVVFSTNPVTGNADEIILETVPGGNELLTDGTVRPIKFVIKKSPIEIKNYPDENIWKDLIENKMVTKIVMTTIEIEQMFLKAQDIEWTVANNNLFVLQSRPITSFNSDAKSPTFTKIKKNHNDIISIYRSYRIPENLQRHMLEVTAVAKWILSNRSDKTKLNERDILTTLLLHDIGNIVKGLDESFANLFPEGYKYMPYWKAVQHWIKGRYGDTDTIATLNMAKEIGVSDRVLFLITNKQFLNNEYTFNSDDMELKICAYSDQRVSPYGILPIRQRLREAVNRYKGATKKISVNDPNRDNLIELAVKIEEQIFSGMKKKPSDVVTEHYMKELRSFNLLEGNK